LAIPLHIKIWSILAEDFMNQTEELKRMIAEHKKLTRIVADNKVITPAILEQQRISGELISLALSDFKCENNSCKSDKNLTRHHFIPIKNEKVIPYHKYISQRHYFFNQAILCVNCHKKIDPEIVLINEPATIGIKTIKLAIQIFKIPIENANKN